jgi:site-specific DNA-methyltransferase (adenine-specific)
LKGLLDEIFGKNNFRNEIAWCYGSGGASKSHFSRKHDTIFWYSKSQKATFNADSVREPYSSPEKVKYKIVNGKEYVRKHELGRISFDWWTIPILTNTAKERTGYPTQKPLALLKRIILASSNEGDIVFDPFCGCATTCVAAQQLGRKWIGIDIAEQSVDILVERLSNDAGMFKDFINTTKVPQRTDIYIVEPKKTVKEQLYKEQKGLCNACGKYFDIWNMEIDHIIPKSKGGGDYYENYQLLCSHCNKLKGNRTMEYVRLIIKTRMEMLEKQVIF